MKHLKSRNYKGNAISGDEDAYSEHEEQTCYRIIPDINRVYFGSTETYKAADYKGIPIIPFAHYAAIMGISMVTELKLNYKYTAVINPNTKTVTVGCQEIPFEKVKELYNQINK